NQNQVNAPIGLTYASILKHALRQDPDILMIGEIRERETAEIAIQASLTGHLVFSTIHTNSAVETLTRILNMGVPAFLMTATINAIAAQRLVRKLCEKCKKPIQIDAPTLEMVKHALTKLSPTEPIDKALAEKLQFYGPGEIPCETCNGVVITDVWVFMKS
ncbi:MAG: ATPase, T2SS/T4P/T4SS family, partial [Patescibacteria group bacterium]